jgi:hypothetical protein
MTTYYVGKGGNDVSAGTTWATRKLTLNGAEDIPVVPGDNVIVGPGVYREILTIDVSGTAGNLITYEGDWDGRRTDGVGGAVRVTGSDDDQTITRAYCIQADAAQRDYRAFVGIAFDMASGDMVDAGNFGADGWEFSYCSWQHYSRGINVEGANGDSADNWTIKNSVFMSGLKGANDVSIRAYTLFADHNEGWLIENCLLLFDTNYGLYLYNNDGGVVRNCTVIKQGWGANNVGVQFAGGTTGGDANNNILLGCGYGQRMIANVDYDYNLGAACADAFNGGVDGGNNVDRLVSQCAPLIGLPDLLTGGFMLPWREWWVPDNGSAMKQIGSTSPATLDLFGKTRPVTASKGTPGAVAWVPKELEATTVYEGTGANLQDDAGRQQYGPYPVDAVSYSFSIYVYRETNYAGSNPQVRIIQPGQATIELTDSGAAASWNELTHTFTPVSLPPWIVIELVSRNTAAAGDYGVIWDQMALTPD